MKTKLHEAKPKHEALYQDFADLLKKHAAELSPIEILAIASNLVGKLIALQDQRVTTPEMALRVVSENIERGNLQAIREVQTQTHGRA